MKLVILDLEWNGTYSRRLKGFINEIIEFGAVMTNDRLEVIDTFEVLVRPQVGKKISGKIETSGCALCRAWPIPRPAGRLTRIP